jgi:hypothetical protein
MLGRSASSVGNRRSYSGEPEHPGITLGGGGNVNPPSTAHTYSAWYEYTPATTEDWDGFLLRMNAYTGGSNVRLLFQIGVGAASSEVPVGGAFGAGVTLSYQYYGGTVFVPVFIPRGSRIAVRWKINIAWPSSERPNLNVSLLGRRATEVRQSYGNHAVYGVSEGTTLGSILLPHNYGDFAWREIVASAPFHVRKIILSQLTSSYGSYVNDRNFSLGIGAASSEVEIAQATMGTGVPLTEIDVDVPAGTRIAFRYGQLSNDTAGIGTMIAHIFG